jgi:membrane protein implicated in regulation of membrane protease activity
VLILQIAFGIVLGVALLAFLPVIIITFMVYFPVILTLSIIGLICLIVFIYFNFIFSFLFLLLVFLAIYYIGKKTCGSLEIFRSKMKGQKYKKQEEIREFDMKDVT